MAAALLLPLTVPAQADTFDPLLLTCSTCSDSNGAFVPLNGGIVSGLQVFSAPPNSGDLQLKILVPNDVGFNFNFSATGTSSGSFSLFSQLAFISGSLEVNYLGEQLAGGAPPNMVTTLLDQTNLFDPLATGFFVFLFDAGTYSLSNKGGGPSPVNIDIAGALPGGSWVLGDLFLNSGPDIGKVVTTATSEGIVSVPGPIVGAGLVPWLLGSGCFGMFGLNRWRKRRRVA